MDELNDLLGLYWELAYAEGPEGRDHDTADGRAGGVLNEIQRLFAATRAAALEEAAKVCDDFVKDAWAIPDAIRALAAQRLHDKPYVPDSVPEEGQG